MNDLCMRKVWDARQGVTVWLRNETCRCEVCDLENRVAGLAFVDSIKNTN